MDVNSLSHTKWNCKYHLVFAPKCCLFLKIAYLWSTCLSADCSVYCHKTTERKSLRAPSLESRVLWDPVIKTMVIISEYTLSYKADSGVFCYEQWWHPCLPRLWRYFEVSRYQTTYPEEGRRRERVSYDPQAPLYGIVISSVSFRWGLRVNETEGVGSGIQGSRPAPLDKVSRSGRNKMHLRDARTRKCINWHFYLHTAKIRAHHRTDPVRRTGFF